jgi:uncharacterized protein YjiS (DUF1127 family)
MAMASIIPRCDTAKAPAERTVTPRARLAAACRLVVGHLDRALLQALTRRQLGALNDRLLRDVGLEGQDVTDPFDQWADGQRWRERTWNGW